MNPIPLAIPPGCVRDGTENQARGRWWDMNLTRWYGRQLGPIGGWRSRSAEQTPVTGAARALLPWRTTVGSRWIAIATNSNLYVQNPQGTAFDITPTGLIVGSVDQLANIGFGSGAFGEGTFGDARQDTGNPIPATVWDLDTFGNYLVGCSSADGGLDLWTLDPLTKAAVMSGSPSSCSGVVVDQNGFILALGAAGDPRKIAWPDQGSTTAWTPTTTNQAGDVDLVTSGDLVTGRRLGGVALVLTDVDGHAGVYVGLPSVFEFSPVGYGCGAISKGCLVAMGSRAAWWSLSGFWEFDGQSALPLECPVYDFLLKNLNGSQRTKVTGFHNSAYGEVWWFYPSASSDENDSYVFWDYRKSAETGVQVWGIGLLARLSASEQSVFNTPLAMGPDGLCYEHETAFAYDGSVPWAKSGPIRLGAGALNMRVQGIIPDEATAGQCTVEFTGRQFPNAPESTFGTTSFDGTGWSNIRFESRQVSLLVQFTVGAASRWGEPSLLASPGSGR